MQPVLYSVTEASQGRSSWVRAASSVCYYRNLYTNAEENLTVDEKNNTSTSKANTSDNATQTPFKIGLKKNDNESK